MGLPPWLGAELGLGLAWQALGLVLGHGLRLSLGLRFCFALWPCLELQCLLCIQLWPLTFCFVEWFGFALGFGLT